MQLLPTPHRGRASGLVLAVAGCLLAAGCTSGSGIAAPSSSAPASSAAPSLSAPSSSPSLSSPTSSPPASSVDSDTLTISVAITGDKVSPNAEKIDVRVGQQVELVVNSDTDDEIHAHTGGDGYQLEVKAGEPTTGRFSLTSAGSFEVESHHLEKVIVILNAR